MAMILEMGAKSVFIQKEEVSGDYAIIYNTLNKDTSNRTGSRSAYLQTAPWR